MSPQEGRVYAESFLIRNKLITRYKRYISLIQFPTAELTPIFIKVIVGSTVTLIAGKTVKYIHLCMLMYAEMDFNLVQVLTFVVYQYMYI